MRERPILYTAAMVRARRDGRKTQTRRLVRQALEPPQGHPAASIHPDGSGTGWVAWWPRPVSAEETKRRYPGAQGFRCPHGVPGDHLWSRETWAAPHQFDSYKPREIPPGTRVHYRASWDGASGLLWRPSMFMPRWASRGLDEVVEVRAQRVQDISEEDALAEGFALGSATGRVALSHGSFHIGPVWPNARAAYRELWDEINGKRAPWASNPWVWAITFKVLA